MSFVARCTCRVVRYIYGSVNYVLAAGSRCSQSRKHRKTGERSLGQREETGERGFSRLSLPSLLALLFARIASRAFSSRLSYKGGLILDFQIDPIREGYLPIFGKALSVMLSPTLQRFLMVPVTNIYVIVKAVPSLYS